MSASPTATPEPSAAPGVQWVLKAMCWPQECHACGAALGTHWLPGVYPPCGPACRGRGGLSSLLWSSMLKREAVTPSRESPLEKEGTVSGPSYLSGDGELFRFTFTSLKLG